MLALAIPIGILIGMSLGALGGGGSILTVPALVYLLGQTPHAATTGSLPIVAVAAIAGMATHWRAGRVRIGHGIAFGLLGVVGSYAGSRLSATINPNLLLAAFSVLMVGAAVAMLRRRRNSASRGNERACTLPSALPRFDTCHGVKVLAAATGVGFLTGLFGVGGGFVIVPALVLALGFDMPVAVGTSLLVIAVNSAAALAVRVGGSTHLDWPLLAVFAAAAIGGTIAGNRVSARFDPAKLTIAFSVLLIAVAAYIAGQSVPHLV